MPPLRACLAGEFADATVTHLQIAHDGVWERARRGVITQPPDLDVIAEFTAGLPSRGECAIEVFARDVGGHVSFCGVRFDEISRTDVHDLARALWTVAHRRVSLRTIVDWLAARAGDGLFDTPCDAVEVGVVDRWRSCGAVRVVPVDGAEPVPDSSRILLAAVRRISAPPSAIIAAEFASATPREHWVAIEIGRVDPAGGLATDVRAASAVLAAVLEARAPG